MKKAILAYFITATAALAHPGHGEPAGHWLMQSDHVVALIVLAIVGALVLTRIRNVQ